MRLLILLLTSVMLAGCTVCAWANDACVCVYGDSGGVRISGDVNAGGDFVGRDAITR